MPIVIDIGGAPPGGERVDSTLCITPEGGGISMGGTAGVQVDQKAPTLAG